MWKMKKIDILSWIFCKIAHILLKEEIYAFHLRLSRERTIYYYNYLHQRIPSILFQALRIGEDHRFYSHGGIDFKAILRIIWYYLRHRIIQGGSTIEQQLTRVLTKRYEFTIKRKFHEILLATCVKEILLKEEILGIYLMVANFGYQMRGIQATCKRLRYNLEELTIPQSADLIARIRYPEPREESKAWWESFKQRKDRIASLLQKELLEKRKIIMREMLLPGSITNKKLIDRYPSSLNFLKAGSELDEFGKKILIRGFTTEGIPSAFQYAPLYYEDLKELIAKGFNIPPKDIFLVGSARLGYSLASKKYGKTMNKDSDLDFVVVSFLFFEKIVTVFKKWEKEFKRKEINPINNKERKYWEKNLRLVPENIKRGFIDVIKIPSYYTLSHNITEICDFIKREINKYNISGMSEVSKVSIRIYKDWDSFFTQSVLNLNYVISEESRSQTKSRTSSSRVKLTTGQGIN